MTHEHVFPDFEDAYPQTVLRWAAETFGEHVALVTSFQPTGIVTLHMLQDIAPQTPVLTLDTGLLFPETYELIEQVEAFFGIQVHRITPEQTVEEQNRAYGPNLWEQTPELCCYRRKVLPLKGALAQYDAWLTGLRRDQSTLRANVPVVSWDEQHQMVKLAPFAAWTEAMIWTYVDAYNLPYNRLHNQGYPSIGCLTCTRAVADGEDKRAGRWANSHKTECGIHLTTISAEAV